MYRTVLASSAFVAAANALGQAIVNNKCSYDVYLQNTPSAGGGYSNVAQTLSQGGSYSQTWTSLSNGNGWSIKLAKDNSFGNDLMQYEYTYQNDGTIWYDLSEVNGNPWDGNWEITATSGCSPRQAAYRYATDDAYGMQDCSSDASITVTLCSGTNGGASGSPAESSPAAYSTPATTAQPSTSVASPPAGHHHHTWNGGFEGKVKAPASPAGDVVTPEVVAPQPEEPATTPTSTVEDSWDGPAVTVTNVHLKTMTQYVTATAAPAKRHVHHPRHPHGRL